MLCSFLGDFFSLATLVQDYRKGRGVIKVTDLSKFYGDNQAIYDLNFEVNKGEVVGFLGPNGAGKSTTMRIITGAMAPSSGLAEVCGFDVFEFPLEVKRRIGYLPETPPVYGDMTVREYLNFVAELKGVISNRRAQLVERALEKTQLGQVQKRMIQNLSKGFRQRVGIAQALVSDPEVLILDEPTVGLDPKQVAEIRSLIQELKGQHTIILSTHILPEVEATCERAVIINKGKIVAQDSLLNLKALRDGKEKLIVVLKKTEGVLEQLKTFSGVTAVSNGRSVNEFEISLTPAENSIDEVAQQIISARLGLIELRRHQVNLEDVFLNLTYGSEATSKQGADL